MFDRNFSFDHSLGWFQGLYAYERLFFFYRGLQFKLQITLKAPFGLKKAPQPFR